MVSSSPPNLLVKPAFAEKVAMLPWDSDSRAYSHSDKLFAIKKRKALHPLGALSTSSSG
jgi:hypothetical protein